MAVTTVTTTMAAGVNYTVVTDTSADWASVANSTYFYDKADKLVHYKDSTGTIQEIFSGSGVTVGTTAVTSGTVGRVFFQGAGDVFQQDSSLFWDNTNKRLGVGANSNSPSAALQVRTNVNTAHDILQISNGLYGNNIFRIRDNATASQESVGSLFIAARIYGSNSTVTGNQFDLGGYGLGASYGQNGSNAVWLNNQGNIGDGAGTSVISVASNVYINLQTTKKYKFEAQTGHFGIGNVGTLGARLDVRAQGALSTDVAFRVRNSADTNNILAIQADGVLKFGEAFTDFITFKASPFNTAPAYVSIKKYANDYTYLGADKSWTYGFLALGHTAPSYYVDAIGNNRYQDAARIGTNHNPFSYNNQESSTSFLFTTGKQGGAWGGDPAVKLAAYTYNINGNTGEKSTFIIGMNKNGTNAQRAAITSQSNLLLQAPTENTNDVGVIYIPNGTAPTDSITDGFKQYSADIVAGNAAPHFRTENGSVIKLYKQDLPTNPTNAEIATFLSNLGLANLI